MTLKNLISGHAAAVDEIYMNRSARLFDAVLDFTETGELHFSHNVCTDVIQSEIRFWGIPERALSSCCYERLVSQVILDRKHAEVATRWRWLEDTRKVVTESLPGGETKMRTPIREHVRLFLEDGSSSIFARVRILRLVTQRI